MRSAAGWAAALILISGCDSSPEPAETNQAAVVEVDYKARIDALDDRQRDAVMLRAVRDARQNCQGVVGSAYSGVQFGMPSWVARCSDGRDWIVMLDKGGRAHVARREEAAGAASKR